MLAWRLLRGFAGASALLNTRTLTSAPAGGWEWAHDPRAIRYGTTSYFGYARGDNAQVVMRTLTDAGVLGAEIVLATNTVTDDHLTPAFLVRDSDHRLMVFYFWGTATSNDTYLRTSVNSLDTDPTLTGGLSAATMIGSQFVKITSQDYANPIQLTGETGSPIWFFYRDSASGLSSQWQYSKSTDGGVTWTAHTMFFTSSPNTRWSYAFPRQNGTARIDFAAIDGNPNSDPTVSLYHFYYQGGSWYKSNGASAGSLPLDQTMTTKVYDATISGYSATFDDMAIDALGRPRIIFPTFISTSDHRYHYALWTGSAWSSVEYANAGGKLGTQNTYSGEQALDHETPTRVYASIGVGGSQWDLRQYDFSSSGATWTYMTILSDGGTNVRPLAVRNHGTKTVFLYLTGSYTDYTTWNQGVGAAGH